MRVLLSAYACEPNMGSEPGVGWNWALQVAKNHEVWVLTRTNNRNAIESELARVPQPNMHFIYHDLPHWARWWKRGSRGTSIYYVLWQLTAVPVVRRLHQSVQFSIAHHVTFASFRFGSVLGLLDIPFVWGPIGGGEQAPRQFWRTFGLYGAMQEAVRESGNTIAQFDPFMRMTAMRAKVIVATSNETLTAIPKRTPAPRQVMLTVGVDTDSPIGQAVRRHDDVLRLLYVGRLVYWKGVQYAIHAVGKANRAGVDIELTIVGQGPFRGKLEALVERLHLSSRVHFLGPLPHATVRALYSQHDSLVFPSFHDSGGFVVLEAMNAGIPVVCVDLGGPKEMVTSTTGIVVPADHPTQVINDIADAFIQFAGDPDCMQAMGAAAREHVRLVFGWNKKSDWITQTYRQVLNRD